MKQQIEFLLKIWLSLNFDYQRRKKDCLVKKISTEYVEGLITASEMVISDLQEILKNPF